MPQGQRSLDRPAPVDRGRSVPGRRFTVTAVTALAPLLLTSCATLGPDANTAADVASAFHRAVEDGDAQAACDLLAPATVEELESSSGQACAESILDQDLPVADRVQGSQAFGRGAQVLMDGDVVFLSTFGGHWLVTAAGCESRGERPYDCTVKGG